MRALVVGFGSIGARHAGWLKELGCDVAVVSARKVDFLKAYSRLDEAVQEHRPDYVVIANTTDQHASSLKLLIQYSFAGRVLVEKPLFKNFEKLELPSTIKCYTAYNLRFHPLLKRMKEILKNEKIVQVQIDVGKYLPTWRPGEAIRYSGNAEQGGGVLRDLSHELDYATWIFGDWKKVVAIKGHYSHLSITSEDAASLLMVTDKVPMLSIQLNYLDRIGRRSIIVQTETFSLHADLLLGTLRVNESTETFSPGRSDTYLDQHRAVLKGDESLVCSYDEGLKIVQLIESAEVSAAQNKWCLA